MKIIVRPDISRWSLEKIISEYVPHGWDKIFDKTKEERETIAQVLTKKNYKTLFPSKENIFRAFELTPLSKVRVVILGQDPYPNFGKHGDPRAQGLSFSVHRQDGIPPSLHNIYKELKREYPDFEIPSHGDLSSWAKQGVLLLNMALTVPPEEIKAHMSLWRPFTNKTVKFLIEERPETIFILWGTEAQKVKQYLGNAHVLESSHPSPQAMRWGGNFFGNNHFIQVNKLLREMEEEPINWQI